jgi:hypothetical protein
MRGYRLLFAFCLTGLLVFSVLAVRDVQGNAAPQLAPRLTQTASYTPSPTPTETPTSTPFSVELLVNGGFEEPDSLDPEQALGWTASNLSKDKRKCKLEKAAEGECYYQFRNGDSEAAKLVQQVPLLSILPAGVELTLSGQYLASGDPKLKIKVLLKYQTLPKEKIVLKLKGITYGVYQTLLSEPLAVTAVVSRLEVVVVNKGTFGKVRLDDLHLTATDGEEILLGLP